VLAVSMQQICEGLG